MTDTLTHEETPSEIVGGEGHGLLTLPDGSAIPYKPHPLADLFPMMTADEHKALVEDVKERGVQRPIVLLDGMVLDGRNRYMAARDAEVGYRVVEFSGDDPVAFVISENLRRRHLNDRQRAMVAAKLADLPRGRQSANLRISPSVAEAAEQLAVKTRQVETARVVVREGAPELVAAVETGKVAVSAAAEVAKLPEVKQVEIVAQGPVAVREAAKAARQARAETAAPSATAAKKVGGASGLTMEALEEENATLKEEVLSLKAKLKKANEERIKLKDLLADLQETDSGAVIRKLNGQIEHMKSQMFRQSQAATAEKNKAYKLKKRVEDLESLPIDMGAV